jgi:hypothetical protein
MLLTDGPFIDSKEYLAGLFLIEADNLDGALATAEELLQETRPGVRGRGTSEQRLALRMILVSAGVTI